MVCREARSFRTSPTEAGSPAVGPGNKNRINYLSPPRQFCAAQGRGEGDLRWTNRPRCLPGVQRCRGFPLLDAHFAGWFNPNSRKSEQRAHPPKVGGTGSAKLDLWRSTGYPRSWILCSGSCLSSCRHASELESPGRSPRSSWQYRPPAKGSMVCQAADMRWNSPADTSSSGCRSKGCPAPGRNQPASIGRGAPRSRCARRVRARSASFLHIAPRPRQPSPPSRPWTCWVIWLRPSAWTWTSSVSCPPRPAVRPRPDLAAPAAKGAPSRPCGSGTPCLTTSIHRYLPASPGNGWSLSRSSGTGCLTCLAAIPLGPHCRAVPRKYNRRYYGFVFRHILSNVEVVCEGPFAQRPSLFP
jgi:hypothetical protein